VVVDARDGSAPRIGAIERIDLWDAGKRTGTRVSRRDVQACGHRIC
jgi:hypothetical protein